ncbi:hypothetical protein JYT71_01185 [Acidimicrobiaceae bacterium AH-315-P05]|nr:hypothetical protein [Acidimicrobiaceae bacterium AH-315-P05]
MNLEQFHHSIRASRDVLHHKGASGALVIMGSQSILASYSALVLDRALVISVEVDILPVARDRSEIERLSDHLDGSLGQDSRFHEAFGFYVDGISIETSVLPGDWIDRLIPEVDPDSGATGWCLDPHDLAVAKLIAGRPKDNDFVDILVVQRLVDPVVVREGLLGLDDPRAARALGRLEAVAASGLPKAARARWHRDRERALSDRRERTSEKPPTDDLRGL